MKDDDTTPIACVVSATVVCAAHGHHTCGEVDMITTTMLGSSTTGVGPIIRCIAPLTGDDLLLNQSIGQVRAAPHLLGCHLGMHEGNR
jgi:hypothetical protein